MKKLKCLMPLLFTMIGFIGIGGLGIYYLLNNPTGLERFIGWGSFITYAAWMAWESKISVRELKITGDDYDRGTMELCAVVKLGLLVAVFTGGSQISFKMGIIGIVLMVFGILIRIAAILKLKQAYSHRIRRLEAPPVSDGTYGIIRHPAYLGTLIGHAGIVIVFTNPYSLFALFLWLTAVLIRTVSEDYWLLTFPEYKMYAEQVRWRLLPGILLKKCFLLIGGHQRMNEIKKNKNNRGITQGEMPIILSVIFMAVIVVLSINKFKGWQGSQRFYGFLLIGLYLLWLLVETSIAVNEISLKNTSCDHRTYEWYAFGRGAVVITALALPTKWNVKGLWIPIGILFFLFGVGIRLWAIWTLGHYYSHRIRLIKNHQIVTSGPYRFIRHPAYTGMLLSHLGFIIFFFNWACFALFLGFFMPAVLKRIFTEEQALLAVQGYRKYSYSKKRLIPFLW